MDRGERSATHSMSRIIFITGTDTGVGKTLLTGCCSTTCGRAVATRWR